MNPAPAPIDPPLPPPRRILVLCTRRLGDVLLTTPLLRSLRRAWPRAELHALTLRWSAPALEGNPDLQRVIAVNESAGPGESLRALGGFRAYDLALSTLPSDRPHSMAFWAAGTRVNLVAAGGVAGAWWKRRLATRHADTDPRLHTVVQYLRLADRAGVPRHYDVVPPRAAQEHPALARLGRRYAVVHPAPMYPYKRWHAGGWSALIRWLSAQGLTVALSGGQAPAERDYVSALAGPGVTNLCGELSFGQLAGLIAGAAVYVGPDTSVTHLAAATGTPTVAIYGPTGTVAWGPWPAGLNEPLDSPWRMAAPWQQRRNVWLLQGLGPCVPCQREGCDRRLDSRADCLDELPAARVIAAAAEALASGRPGERRPG